MSIYIHFQVITRVSNGCHVASWFSSGPALRWYCEETGPDNTALNKNKVAEREENVWTEKRHEPIAGCLLRDENECYTSSSSFHGEIQTRALGQLVLATKPLLTDLAARNSYKISLVGF